MYCKILHVLPATKMFHITWNTFIAGLNRTLKWHVWHVPVRAGVFSSDSNSQLSIWISTRQSQVFKNPGYGNLGWKEALQYQFPAP